MFDCPNCGGELRFDIEIQGMLCPFCNSAYDPQTVEQERDVEEQDEFEKEADTFEATVFTCPQCGGEILSLENEATSFCSYCGASTILTSRLSHEKKPEHIIPFQITKEECKSTYTQMMKGAFFAPKELREEGAIDKFRAIYMPYWVYDMKQYKYISLRATKSYDSGYDHVTEDYIISGTLDAYYDGVSYDASASFSDSVSANIAPYDVRGMTKFAPGYLAGFYADTADVEREVYLSDAKTFANNATMDEITNMLEFEDKFVKRPREDRMSEFFGTRCEKIGSAMFPVWFLSYRKGDRVAYATVNGQTGKVACDLPVDMKKYLLVSLLMAVPLFLLLSVIVSVSPGFVLMAGAFLALITMFIHVAEIREIGRTELQLDNKGFLSKRRDAINRNMIPFCKPSLKSYLKPAGLSSQIASVYGAFPLIFVLLSLMGVKIFSVNICVGIMFAISIYPLVRGLSMYSHIPQKYRKPGFMWGFVAIMISFMVILIDPVSDWIYYVGTAVSLAAVLCTMLSVIHGYNILSTRPLPQLDK